MHLLHVWLSARTSCNPRRHQSRPERESTGASEGTDSMTRRMPSQTPTSILVKCSAAGSKATVPPGPKLGETVKSAPRGWSPDASTRWQNSVATLMAADASDAWSMQSTKRTQSPNIVLSCCATCCRRACSLASCFSWPMDLDFDRPPNAEGTVGGLIEVKVLSCLPSAVLSTLETRRTSRWNKASCLASSCCCAPSAGCLRTLRCTSANSSSWQHRSGKRRSCTCPASHTRSRACSKEPTNAGFARKHLRAICCRCRL
mmetsp:Transcript_1516/g.4154  ORF Transcript_1516/g.4154 Transcript_1516/m.4154 type:complete len:259 (+) Transcript_1516:1190-1966(+)